MQASIADVALRAGVSTATVSHVLNGTRRTRPHTRQRVLAAIQELGYAQNEAARNLALGRSSVLGLVISDIRNPFFPEVTSAFQDQAVAHNMDAMVVNTNYDAPRLLHSVKRLIGLQVPGIAILTSQIDPSVMEMIASRKIAAVYLDLGRVDRFISNIMIDYEQGISEALEHLSAFGHRRIGYIGGPLRLHSAKRRKTAFAETAARLGLEPGPMIEADFTVRGGYFAFGKLLQQSAPTAVLAANDLMAIGILHRAYDAGLHVPRDLSVVGFDDIVFAEYTQPGLTTVAVPRPEIGQVAFEALRELIADPESSGREFRVATRLVTRQSSAQPRNS